MKTNTRMGVALAAALLTAAAVPAMAAMIAPASFIDGKVTAVDLARNTVTLGNELYFLRSPSDLEGVNTGDELRLTYYFDGGRRMAFGVEEIGGHDRDTPATDSDAKM